jgi:hypothetical protein
MSNTSAGLPNNGNTLFYKVQYDASLSGPGGLEPARSAGLVNTCDADFMIMQRWFDNTSVDTPIELTVTTESGGASWSDPQAVKLKPGNGNTALLRYLVVSEVTEIFAKEQFPSWYAAGWLNSDEGSMGEGLSRFLSALFMIKVGIGTGPAGSFQVSNLWLNSPRSDFVNNAPDDHQPDAVSGCSTLFLYYLHRQLGFSIQSIIRAGASNLADVYQNLTHDSTDPFPTFKNLLDIAFPSTTASSIAASNADDPFPLPTTRTLSTRRFLAALPQIAAFRSVRVLIAVRGQHSLRPALNSNRPASLI